MPVLTNQQRTWLGVAVQNKGRLTTKKAVKKQLAEYIRRREKTAVAFKSMSLPDTDYDQIKDGLTHADGLANAGNLKAAYKYLETIKVLAKGHASGRGDLIAVDTIRNETDNIGRLFGQQVYEINQAKAAVIDLLGQIEAAPKAGDLATLHEALTFRKNFIAEEARLRTAHQNATQICNTAAAAILPRNIVPRLDQLDKDIAAVKVTGRGKEIESYEKRLATMRAKLAEERGFYNQPVYVRNYPDDQLADFERALNACKSLEKWQNRDGEDVIADDKTDAIRSGLTPLDAKALKALKALKARIEAEEGRMQRAADAIQAQYDHDQIVLADTSTGAYTVPPELPKFVAADTLDDLANGIVIANVISDVDAATIATRAAKSLRDFITDANSDPHEIFDLTLMHPKDLKAAIARDVLGTTNPDDWTPSQIDMLDQALAEAQRSLAANLPNTVSADGNTLTIGGKDYSEPQILKQGGNGKATKYTAADGTSVVVKTPFSNQPRELEDQRRKLAYEMEAHHRAMEGRDPLATDSAIVEMLGAARGEDGSLFMIMEEMDGGDLDDLNAVMSAASRSGMIPEEARQAIALGNLLGAVEGLKELERQGLVHHDIKGENVMMTSDGKIKIIDYGEASFVDNTGKITEFHGGTTPGFEDPGVFQDPSHDTKVDVFAISGMLQSLVGDLYPDDSFGESRMESGVLGRLIAACRDPDPAKRPSLDAILQSALATSFETDFNPENVKELQAASADFASQATGVSGAVDLVDMATKLSAVTVGNLGDPMKLKNAQVAVVYLEEKARKLDVEGKEDPDSFLTSGREELAALRKEIGIIQIEIIKPMLDDAVEHGKDAYETAIDDTNLKFDISIKGKIRNVTLKQAIVERDKLVTNIEDGRQRMIALLNASKAPEGLGPLLDRFNAAVTEADEQRKDMDKAIYDAVGPDAKFFLAKVKMEKAAEPFGPTGNPESEEGVEDKGGFEELKSNFMTDNIREELKEKSAG